MKLFLGGSFMNDYIILEEKKDEKPKEDKKDEKK